jgi:hypothetical protein
VILLGALLAAGLLLGGAEAMSLNRALLDLQSGAADLERAGSGLGQNPESWTSERIGAAERDQAAAALKVERARNRLHSDRLITAAVSLPNLGDQLRTAIEMADAAGDATAALGDLIAVARIYEAARAAPGPPGPNFVGALERTAPLFDDADKRLRHALAQLRPALQRPLAAQLANRLRQEVDLIGRAQLDTSGAAASARSLPSALGADGPKTYLLISPTPPSSGRPEASPGRWARSRWPGAQ